MGPAEPIARSESIVNSVINFIRALSPTERRTQFIALGIFAGLSSVTAILLSCYKKFHQKATVPTPTANPMALLRGGGAEGCAKAAEIVKIPDQSDKSCLEEVLKNHPALLEKFIFSDDYLNDVMPIILEFLTQKKYLVSIANFCRFAQIAITDNGENLSYQKCSDLISESLALLGTDQEVTGLRNLAVSARYLIGAPTFLTLQERQAQWQKVEGTKWFPGYVPLRENFWVIKEKFANYPRLERDYKDICYAAYPEGKNPRIYLGGYLE